MTSISESIGMDIIIEGNIGAGKSTLVQLLRYLLKEYFPELRDYREPIKAWSNEKNNLLEKSYQDPAQYAFEFQLMVLDSYVDMHMDTYEKQDSPPLRIFERSIFGTLPFTLHHFDTKTFTVEQMKLLATYIQTIYKTMFDNRKTYCYLLQPMVETCFERIQSRHQVGDKYITLSYLKAIQNWIDMTFINPTIIFPEFDLNKIVNIDVFRTIAPYENEFEHAIDVCFIILEDIAAHTRHQPLVNALKHSRHLVEERMRGWIDSPIDQEFPLSEDEETADKHKMSIDLMNKLHV